MTSGWSSPIAAEQPTAETPAPGAGPRADHEDLDAAHEHVAAAHEDLDDAHEHVAVDLNVTPQPVTPQPVAPSSPWEQRLTTADDAWRTHKPPPRAYLMRDTRTDKGALDECGVCLFVAAGGVGKSFAGVAAALAVTTATPWLGVLQPERRGRVLIVSAEDPRDELRRRIFHVAAKQQIPTLSKDALDVVDVHDAHVPLLTSDAEPTEYADALVELVRKRGPYALIIIDPLARVAGANIDGDNTAAGALVTQLERVATAARGLVLALHHTSKAARRDNVVSALAIRGPTALGDSSRMALLLTADSPKGVDTHLAAIVTATCVKANYTREWDPIQLRRADHGVLVPLDDADRALVEEARQVANPTTKRRAERQAEREAQEARYEQSRAARQTAKEQAQSRQDAADDDAVRRIVGAHPGIGSRDLLAKMAAALHGCGQPRVDRAVERVGVERRLAVRGKVGGHYLPEADQ